MSEVIRPWETELDDIPVRMFPNEHGLDAYRQRYPTQNRKLGVVAVRLYWMTPEQDNASAYFREDDALHETVIYGQEELVTWLGGIALSRERERILHIANREAGSFDEIHKWRPMTFVKWKPSAEEQEMWIAYEEALIDNEWNNWDND